MTEKLTTFPENHPRITSFKINEYDNVYSSHTHYSGAHELLYVLEGRMTLHLGENLEYRAGPGDFLIIPAGTPHRDEFAVLKGLRIHLIIFKWDAEEYFKYVNCRTLFNLPSDVRSEARRRLEFIRAHWNSGAEGVFSASLQLYSILSLFYFAGEETAPKVPVPSAAEVMQRVKHFLDQNCNSQITLKDAAEFANLSPSYLSRLFHHEFGVSFNAYLTARRLESARHLLQTTRLQIAEIASRCGFSSSSYFIKVFRTHYGVTPKNHTEVTAFTGKGGKKS